MPKALANRTSPTVKTLPPPPTGKVVADIRSTHGGGKTWLMRQLLSRTKWESFVGPGRASKNGPVKDRHLGFVSEEWDAAIVGNYDPAKTSGGCDIIQDPEEVCRRVRLFSSTHRLVFLEGVLVSHTYQRYADLARELAGGEDLFGESSVAEPVDYRFYFLDTPLQTCIERVRARNAASTAANVKPFRDVNVRKDHHMIWDVVRAKCKKAGHHVVELDHRRPLPQLLESLGLS